MRYPEGSRKAATKDSTAVRKAVRIDMVYLIHFEQPYHHARHYIGFTDGDETLEQRIDRHRRGDGAKLLRAVSQAGIEFKVVRVWEHGDRTMERRLKSRKKAWRYCPVCRETMKKKAVWMNEFFSRFN